MNRRPDRTEPLAGPSAQRWLEALRSWRLGSFLFRDEGRIGRRAFWFYIAAVMALAFAIFFTRSLRQSPLAHAAFGGLLLFPSYCVFAKRLQDFGVDRRWALPIVIISAIDLVLAASGLKSRPGRLAGLLPVWEWIGLVNVTATLIVLGGWPGTLGRNGHGERTPPW